MATAHSLRIRTLAGQHTICQGQCCDLKVEKSGRRWWLCRMPHNRTDHRITIENYNMQTGCWETEQVFTDEVSL